MPDTKIIVKTMEKTELSMASLHSISTGLLCHELGKTLLNAVYTGAMQRVKNV